MPHDTISARRILIFDLDSLSQRRQWHLTEEGAVESPIASWTRTLLGTDTVVSAQGLRWFTGRLRTADLLSDTILVTDAQLLDGVFFQYLGADGVHALLGRDALDGPAITVLGRGRSLEESLREMAVGNGTAFTSFEYSVLSPIMSTPEELRAGLDTLDPGRVAKALPGEVSGALAAVLHEAVGEGSKVYLDQVARAWEGWINAERDGLVGYEQIRPSDDDLWDNVVAQWSSPSTQGRSDSWVVVRDQLRGIRVRSDVRALLRRSVIGGGLDEASHDELYRWWEHMYMDLLARRNNAAWLTIEGEASPAPQSAASSSAARRRATLGGAAPSILGDMPVARYSILLYEARKVLTHWRREQSQTACDRIAYAVQAASRDVDLIGERRILLVGLLLSLGLALTGFFGGLIEQPSGRAALMAALGVLALTLLAELLRGLKPIWDLRRARLRSVIHLDGPSE